MNSEILAALERINGAWRESRFDDLVPLLDEGIVMKGPGMKELGRGRQALIDSYAQFMASSTVTEYTESGHAADSWGDTAVVTYDWTMTYEQKGKTSRESGHDMFVFARRDARWAAVMRLILF